MTPVIIVNLSLILLLIYFTKAVNASGNHPTTSTSIRPIGEIVPTPSIMPIGEVVPTPSIRPIGEVVPTQSIRPIGEDVPTPSIRSIGENVPTPSIRPIGEVVPIPPKKDPRFLKLSEGAQDSIRMSFKNGSTRVDDVSASMKPMERYISFQNPGENIGSIRRKINTFPPPPKNEKTFHNDYQFNFVQIREVKKGGWVAYYRCAGRCRGPDGTMTRLKNKNGKITLNHEHAIDCEANKPPVHRFRPLKYSHVFNEKPVASANVQVDAISLALFKQWLHEMEGKERKKNLVENQSQTIGHVNPPILSANTVEEFNRWMQELSDEKRNQILAENQLVDSDLKSFQSEEGSRKLVEDQELIRKYENFVNRESERQSHFGPDDMELGMQSIRQIEKNSDSGSVQVISAMPSHVQPRIRDNQGLNYDDQFYFMALNPRDMNELAQPHGWLGNFVINAYLQLLTRDRDDARFVPSDVITTYWGSKVINLDWLQQQIVHGGIHSVRFWFILAHLHGNHWALAVFDLEFKCVVFCDSLNRGQNTNENMGFRDALFDFFTNLYAPFDMHLNMNQVQWINRDNIPRQMNGWDCGVFLLMYAEEIIRSNDIFTNFTFSQEIIPDCRARIHRELMMHYFPAGGVTSTDSIRPMEETQSIRAMGKSQTKSIRGMEKNQSIGGMGTQSIRPFDLNEPSTAMEIEGAQSHESMGSGISGSIRNLDDLQIESIRKKKKMESGIIRKSIRKTAESIKLEGESHESIPPAGRIHGSIRQAGEIYGSMTAKYVKNEYGGYFLVHDGYFYLNAKNFVTISKGTGLWMCEERETSNCMGYVRISGDNKIIDSNGHKHYPRPAAERLKGKEIYDHFKNPLTQEDLKNLTEDKKVYVDGFTYLFNKGNKNFERIYVICEDTYTAAKCRGRAIIVNGHIDVTIQHNHKGKQGDSNV